MANKKYLEVQKTCLKPVSQKKQKQTLYRILLKYRQAFSLRDEIGLCQHLEVNFELSERTPFHIRLFQLIKRKRLL